MRIVFIDIEPVDFVAFAVVINYFEKIGTFFVILQVLVVDFVEAFFVDRHAIDDDFHIEVKQKIVKELMQELECSNLLR